MQIIKKNHVLQRLQQLPLSSAQICASKADATKLFLNHKGVSF